MQKIKMTTDGNNLLGAKVFPIIRPWNTDYQPGTTVTLYLSGAEVGQAQIIRGIKYLTLATIPEIMLMLSTGSTNSPEIRQKLEDYYKNKLNLERTPFGIYILKRIQ